MLINHEFISGALSGLVQNIVGHPFDTAKTLIQNKMRLYTNPFYYYRGFIYPTSFSILLNGSVFYLDTYLYPKLYHSHYLSGFVTGAIISPFIFLFDIGKIKNQINSNLTIHDIYQTKGIYSTLWRESIAVSIFLGSYYQLKTEYKLNPLLSGGITGLLNWTITYPLDTIKTRQMSLGINMIDAFRMGKLWKGYFICAIRSILVNSAGFQVYEYSKKLE